MFSGVTVSSGRPGQTICYMSRENATISSHVYMSCRGSLHQQETGHRIKDLGLTELYAKWQHIREYFFIHCNQKEVWSPALITTADIDVCLCDVIGIPIPMKIALMMLKIVFSTMIDWCTYYIYGNHTMDLLWEKFQWILPLYMKPISYQAKASVVCSVTAVIFIDFCLKKLNVFSQHIGKNKWISEFRRTNPQELKCWSSFCANYFLRYYLMMQHQPIVKIVNGTHEWAHRPYQLLITAACTNTCSKMKGSHSRAADRCPFVPRHSLSQVTFFMQLGMWPYVNIVCKCSCWDGCQRNLSLSSLKCRYTRFCGLNFKIFNLRSLYQDVPWIDYSCAVPRVEHR